ncbi:MAG: hypothetical protein R2780_15160 [Crocinitomicaceae bacterium]
MKTKTLFMFLFLFSLRVLSCDNCNVYFNLNPNDGKHNIGFYYRTRVMQGLYNGIGLQTMTKHASHGNDPAFWGNQVQETYRTYELRGEFLIKNRWRTYVILPFVQNSQYIDDNKRYTVSGIGDPILMESFQIIDPTRLSKNENVTQRLELGAGVKAPLGKVNIRVENETPNLDLQPGSGSWNFLAFIKYSLKIKNGGLMVNTNFKRSTFNSDGYRYGNVLNCSGNYFYQTKIKSLTLIPSVGVNAEYARHDFTTEEQFETGGVAIFANGGLQMFWKKFRLFGEFQKAVFNKMNGYTQLINKYKFNVGFSYYF